MGETTYFPNTNLQGPRIVYSNWMFTCRLSVTQPKHKVLLFEKYVNEGARLYAGGAWLMQGEKRYMPEERKYMPTLMPYLWKSICHLRGKIVLFVLVFPCVVYQIWLSLKDKSKGKSTYRILNFCNYPKYWQTLTFRIMHYTVCNTSYIRILLWFPLTQIVNSYFWMWGI